MPAQLQAMPDGSNIRPLTSLRFFAALWVVLFSYWENLAVDWTPAIVTRGKLGVELFFVLSGFILSHVYLTSFGERRFRYGGFLWNRLARVYPLHLATMLGLIALALAATAAGIVVDEHLLSWRSLPANLLMLQAWGLSPDAAFNHPAWSISAEWFAYVCFPGFAFVFWRLRDKPWLAAAGVLAFLAVLYPLFRSLAGFELTDATIRWGALRIVPCFALGCAAYLLWRSGAVRSARSAALGASLLGAGLLIGASFGAPSPLMVAGFGGLILCLAGLAQHGSSFGSQPVFVYLGEISYSTYMICVPWKILFVNLATRALNLDGDRLPLPVWLFFVAAIVPLSALSYHLIEKPARERMKLIAGLWKTRQSVAA
jgi:peptidoglycan/LPS O-acetylase OafA/YrhL